MLFLVGPASKSGPERDCVDQLKVIRAVGGLKVQVKQKQPSNQRNQLHYSS